MRIPAGRILAFALAMLLGTSVSAQTRSPTEGPAVDVTPERGKAIEEAW